MYGTGLWTAVGVAQIIEQECTVSYWHVWQRPLQQLRWICQEPRDGLWNGTKVTIRRGNRSTGETGVHSSIRIANVVICVENVVPTIRRLIQTVLLLHHLAPAIFIWLLAVGIIIVGCGSRRPPRQTRFPASPVSHHPRQRLAHLV